MNYSTPWKTNSLAWSEKNLFKSTGQNLFRRVQSGKGEGHVINSQLHKSLVPTFDFCRRAYFFYLARGDYAWLPLSRYYKSTFCPNRNNSWIRLWPNACLQSANISDVKVLAHSDTCTSFWSLQYYSYQHTHGAKYCRIRSRILHRSK